MKSVPVNVRYGDPVTRPDDPWEGPTDYRGFGPAGPAPSLRQYGQQAALRRFNRDELRSSERVALAAAIDALAQEALVSCRGIVDEMAARAVDDFPVE